MIWDSITLWQGVLPLRICQYVVQCTGFEKRVIVSSSTLKSLEVFSSGVELQVEALNLETFRFGQNGHASNYRRLLCNIQFSSCGALRNLAFFQAWFVGAWFDNLSSKFPVLESLILYKCGIDRGDLKVFSKNLKHIVLGGCDHKMNVEVVTPNLHTIRFIGSRSIYSRMFAPNLFEATVILDKTHKRTRWDTYHITLRDFLANFDCSGKLSIYAFGSEVCKMPSFNQLSVSCMCCSIVLVNFHLIF